MPSAAPQRESTPLRCFLMLFSKGKRLATELSRFSLCTYTCLIVHVLLFKTSSLAAADGRICLKKNMQLLTFRSPSLAEIPPSSRGAAAPAQLRAPGVSQLTGNDGSSEVVALLFFNVAVLSKNRNTLKLVKM